MQSGGCFKFQRRTAVFLRRRRIFLRRTAVFLRSRRIFLRRTAVFLRSRRMFLRKTAVFLRNMCVFPRKSVTFLRRSSISTQNMRVSVQKRRSCREFSTAQKAKETGATRCPEQRVAIVERVKKLLEAAKYSCGVRKARTSSSTLFPFYAANNSVQPETVME